jgi:membrane-associated progesterone receptor component
MSDPSAPQKKERFAPKEPVSLAPPKDDVISRDYLAKCDGTVFLGLLSNCVLTESH